MAKVGTYEGGCPACGSYGQVTLDSRGIQLVLQYGAVGAAAGLASEFVAKRVLRVTNPFLIGLLSVAVPVGLGAFISRGNPQMGEAIAVGGAATGIYTLLKNLVGRQIGLSGLDGDELGYDYGEELGLDYGQEYALEEPEVEIEGDVGETGVLVPEVEETEGEGYGVLVPEVEETEGLPYGQNIYIETE